MWKFVGSSSLQAVVAGRIEQQRSNSIRKAPSIRVNSRFDKLNSRNKTRKKRKKKSKSRRIACDVLVAERIVSERLIVLLAAV